MNIPKKPASALYKLLVGIVAVGCFWLTLATFGIAAWRLFTTWILVATAVYFFSSALVLALSEQRNYDDAPAPIIEGGLIIGFLLATGTAIFCHFNDISIPGMTGFIAAVIYFFLPVLVILDWAIFCHKGRWRAIDPFYWLAFPACYAATILFTTEILPSKTTDLRYPLPFLDYVENGLAPLVYWLLILGIIIVVAGYILTFVDLFLGGVISQHIVLPHIRTVPIEPEGPTTDDNLEAALDQATEVYQAEEFIAPSYSTKATNSTNSAKPKSSPKINDIKKSPKRPNNKSQKSQKFNRSHSYKSASRIHNNKSTIHPPKNTDGFNRVTRPKK